MGRWRTHTDAHCTRERELIEYAMVALAESQLDSLVILHKKLVRRIDSVPDSKYNLKEIEAICKRAGKDNGIKIKLQHKPERSSGRDRRRDDHRGGGGRYRESGRHNEPFHLTSIVRRFNPSVRTAEEHTSSPNAGTVSATSAVKSFSLRRSDSNVTLV